MDPPLLYLNKLVKALINSFVDIFGETYLKKNNYHVLEKNKGVGLGGVNGGTSPNLLHFSLHSRRGEGTQITPLIHLSVYSYLFSLDVVTT